MRGRWWGEGGSPKIGEGGVKGEGETPNEGRGLKGEGQTPPKWGLGGIEPQNGGEEVGRLLNWGVEEGEGEPPVKEGG